MGVITGAFFATMLDFVDTKLFGAAFTGVGTLATSYVAGASDWRLIALPLLIMIAYYLVFHDPMTIGSDMTFFLSWEGSFAAARARGYVVDPVAPNRFAGPELDNHSFLPLPPNERFGESKIWCIFRKADEAD